jgi:hypothetical protein
MVNRPMDLTTQIPARLRCVAVVLAAAVVLGGGCSSGTHSGPTKEEQQRAAQSRTESALTFENTLATKQHRVSIQELDELTSGFADRYFMVMSSAVDAIKRGNTDPTQRRTAHQIKLNGVLAVDDIVSQEDPYAEVLDLVVAVTLQSIVWIDENRAEQAFGDRAPLLINALDTMHDEAWKLAEKVLTQEQLELLDYLILEWRRTHPQIVDVAFVKFDNFAGVRANDLISDFKAGGGFLAPLSEASQVMKDWGRLTERAFWYSKRVPNIAAIQAEGAVNEILAAPEIGSMLEATTRVSKMAETLPQTMDAQRKAFFAELDARQTLLTNSLADVRHIVADASALGANATVLATNLQLTLTTFNQTLRDLDAVGRHYRFDQPGARPYDIEDYIVTLTRLNDVVTNLEQLSLDADQLAQSKGWQHAVKDLTDATDRRVDRAFSRLCVLLGIAFVLAIIYRIISIKLTKRLSPMPPEKL